MFLLLDNLFYCLENGVLLHQISISKNANGISIRSIELYILAFVVEMLFTMYSYVDAISSTAAIVSSLYFIYIVFNREPFKTQYFAQQEDTFQHWKYIALPCILLACICNFVQENLTLEGGLESSDESRIEQTATVFAFFLECIAILPQILILKRHRTIENLKIEYMICIAVHRGFSLFSWPFRKPNTAYSGSTDWIEIICNLVHTCSSLYFLYTYKLIRQDCKLF